jgi:ectoine hydroxylase-related dioxygenase (phytanoyl-CoA dioxygenase family)
MQKSYGVTAQRVNETAIDAYYEELTIKGYTIVPDVLDQQALATARQKLDEVYNKQATAFGEQNLIMINEKDFVRAPFAYDNFFLQQVAANKTVLDVVEKAIGKNFILHLQNGIINRPNEEHHQSSWHRDLPYQNFVISKPLAIGALYCIDDFTIETGCTWVVPFTHKIEEIPSNEYIEKNKIPALAKAGSVILFDSMLFHQAGFNSSNIIRRAINNVYVVPILKQQIDIPRMLGDNIPPDPAIRLLLGYDFAVPGNDREWRQQRVSKLKRSN